MLAISRPKTARAKILYHTSSNNSIYTIYIYFRSHFIASRLDQITLYIIRRRPQEKMVKIRDKIKNVTGTEWIHNYVFFEPVLSIDAMIKELDTFFL